MKFCFEFWILTLRLVLWLERCLIGIRTGSKLWAGKQRWERGHAHLTQTCISSERSTRTWCFRNCNLSLQTPFRGTLGAPSLRIAFRSSSLTCSEWQTRGVVCRLDPGLVLGSLHQTRMHSPTHPSISQGEVRASSQVEFPYLCLQRIGPRCRRTEAFSPLASGVFHYRCRPLASSSLCLIRSDDCIPIYDVGSSGLGRSLSRRCRLASRDISPRLPGSMTCAIHMCFRLSSTQLMQVQLGTSISFVERLLNV